MHLSKLSILQFKNYSEAELNFSHKVNCFVGNNGSGKTNLLDAIHYLSLCKSYFNTIDSQNIKHGFEFALIQGSFLNDDSEDEVYCGIKRNKKKVFKRNRKEYDRLADHIGMFPLVMVSPADSSLITEGGEERRRFMNTVIAQYDKNYIDDLLQYNKALAQRNKLLKDISVNRGFDKDVIGIWDDQMVRYGERIYHARREFIENIVSVFQDCYQFISSGKEEAGLEYISQLHGSNMKNLLEGAIGKDLALQYTTSGIHRDELQMTLDSYPIKKTGSQGQQKTFQVALKLAKFSYIRKLSGKTPILLLDDIFDKFDMLRVEQIIKLVINEKYGQIFITDTNEEHLSFILKKLNSEHKVFRIDSDQKIVNQT